jgi:hypothetical protein
MREPDSYALFDGKRDGCAGYRVDKAEHILSAYKNDHYG